ncbi:MAG: MarR family transcriptional regulator [Firmicutes bacterium]|nr:MarR family transcriptional regulator [Bacillota bacterium]
MSVAEDLLMGNPLSTGQEQVLSVLLAREQLLWVMEERVFKPSGLTEPQFNVLRILKGGPDEGYTIGEIRRRMIARNTDTPRLVDRMVMLGLVRRQQSPADRRHCHVRLTAKGRATLVKASESHDRVLDDIEGLLSAPQQRTLVKVLERFRQGLKRLAGEETR